MLKARDSSIGRRLAFLAERQNFVEWKHLSTYTRNKIGAYGLMSLGENAKCAVPELIQIYNRDHSLPTDYFIPRIFISIGPAAKDAIPSLLKRLQNQQNPDGQSDALFALNQMLFDVKIDTNSNLIVPDLIQLTNDPKPEVRGLVNSVLRDFEITNKSPTQPIRLNWSSMPPEVP